MNDSELRSYEVKLRSRRVRKEIDSLNQPDYRRVVDTLKELSINPRPFGCEKLTHDIYRVRVGNWRIIYIIDQVNKKVEVGGIRRRSERTYRDVEDLFR